MHGVGGTLGALLTGVFCTRAVSGLEKEGLLDGNFELFRNQVIGVAASAAMALVGTFILIKILDATMGLRVAEEDEIRGLDITQHGEEGYIFL